MARKIKASEKVNVAKVEFRPPVVTIMGHVDHGKTTLLDAIRKTNVAAKEFGGITQHIGAYQVLVKPKGAKEEKLITFIDTPGHAAFTEMRARGGKVADIVILVVAADDGVMPQTKEAISHAKAAGVPVIVAINKIDVLGASPEKVKQQLAEEGVLVEGWGGDVVCVEVSAKQGKNIDELLEMILLVAEMQQLKSEPDASFEGLVIESRLDQRRGPLATVLVEKGILRQQDVIYAGDIEAKVKLLLDYQGKLLKEANPSCPVEVLGFAGVPPVGAVVSGRKAEAPKEEKKITLSDFSAQKETEAKILNLILKTDVAGSLEAIQPALVKLETESLQIRFLHVATGDVTDSDVLLASASNAVILAFNVKVSGDIKYLAKDRGVEIREYNIIYELIEDVDKALKGILEEKPKEKIKGEAEILKLFPLPSGDVVFGCRILGGRIKVDDRVEVKRKDVEAPIGVSEVEKIKEFKEYVSEARMGKECGILLKSVVDGKVGDLLVVLF